MDGKSRFILSPELTNKLKPLIIWSMEYFATVMADPTQYYTSGSWDISEAEESMPSDVIDLMANLTAEEEKAYFNWSRTYLNRIGWNISEDNSQIFNQT